MEEAIIIGAIIQIITLTVFFVMASNVSKIKKHIDPDKRAGIRYFEMAQEEIYLGNKEKAKEYLLRVKFHYEVRMEYCCRMSDKMEKEKNVAMAKVDKLLSEL